MTFHAQCGEDKWITENLQLPENGVFVEVGAFDGVLSSNTYHFEQLGWTGLIIEPDPELASKCLLNRKCDVSCCAIGTETGDGTFYINPNDRGLSGLHREGNPIRTKIVRLDDLLKAYSIYGVDFLSIDTEGTEIDVWQSLVSKRFLFPKIVMMEWSTLGLPPNDEAITQRLGLDDYELIHSTQYNLIFTRPMLSK